ncbi:putative protein tesmin/TSO1-like CXC 2 [Cocos nucifera]|uniref:CRC domain-containing protein n=1 Tax=Cocos nucifera TaxID=13894 RepID=A0A8K0IAW7_COCNU|nr:putative protein tesmin/TSO1-like CXC 2 [Cocos nucifera]
MCDTSYRHSNCLDQYCRAFSESRPSQNDEGWQPTKLSCPLCRRLVTGWTVVEPARRFLNAKIRSCAMESSGFSGVYGELRKHASKEHPSVRPSEVDPEWQQNWRRLEEQRDLGDLFSMFQLPISGEEDGIGISKDDGEFSGSIIPFPSITVFLIIQVTRAGGESATSPFNMLRHEALANGKSEKQKEDDTQKHLLQLEAVENSRANVVSKNSSSNAEAATVTYASVFLNLNSNSDSSFLLKAPTTSSRTDLRTDLLVETTPGDAIAYHQQPNSSITYRSPVPAPVEASLIGSPMMNLFFVNPDPDDIENMTCPPETNNSMHDALQHADGSIETQLISTRNETTTTQVKKPTGKEESQHCSCKKSNCLKLYCDCFASGSFCAGACRCNECYNKPEYEEIVNESKERIQSRMPHAFAPKIIRDGRNMITTSNRHRVGCNCRKSMCMKNYCECFKAHVGCSSVCRCEDSSGEIGEMEGESQTVKVKSEMTKPGQCHTSISPCIRSSIQNEPNPSAASGTSVLSSYTDSWKSPIDSRSRTSFVKAGQGTPTFSSYYQASGGHDAENFCSFLPHCDNFSGGIVFGPSSNCKLLQTNVFQGRDHLSVNSLPLTGGSINELELDLDTNSGLRNNLEHNYESLKDSSSPIKAVKTSSSNQEPLSPSHKNIQETQPSVPPR